MGAPPGTAAPAPALHEPRAVLDDRATMLQPGPRFLDGEQRRQGSEGASWTEGMDMDSHGPPARNTARSCRSSPSSHVRRAGRGRPGSDPRPRFGCSLINAPARPPGRAQIWKKDQRATPSRTVRDGKPGVAPRLAAFSGEETAALYAAPRVGPRRERREGRARPRLFYTCK